jgi:DNA-binding transcriptional ArsR family regulator
VNEIADGLPVSRPAVSQHLRVLRDAGLVDFEPHGTRNLYRLDRAGFDELRHWLDTYWQEVLDAFEGYAMRSATQRGT